MLYESVIVMDYIDEIYPEAKLTPMDPFVRSKARILGEEFSKVCAIPLSSFPFLFLVQSRNPSQMVSILSSNCAHQDSAIQGSEKALAQGSQAPNKKG